MKRAAIIMALMAISALALGCTGQKGLTFEVKGLVEKPGTYDLNDYKDKMVTINAKLDGEVTHLPARDYTGVPLRAVLSEAGVKGGASLITISASDGYTQSFELSNVTASDDIILIDDNDTVRVVAKGYPGGKWVEMVTSIEVT